MIVDYAKTKVQVKGEPLASEIWIGRQWAVTDAGIEARDGTYFISKERLLEANHGSELLSWPIHMAEKTWLDHDDFVTAFMVALAIFELNLEGPDLVRRSIAKSYLHP